MEFAIFWVFFPIITAIIASHKERSGVGWFVLGLLLGPFALVVAFLPSREAQAQARASLITRLRLDAALSDHPPPRPLGTTGRPRL